MPPKLVLAVIETGHANKDSQTAAVNNRVGLWNNIKEKQALDCEEIQVIPCLVRREDRPAWGHTGNL